jgi:hypothetical protein
MTLYIEYTTTKDGIEYSKWIPSIHYEDICERLLKLMKGGRQKIHQYGAPFVLTLVAYFESNLNDWLTIDTFNKHGPAHYEAIVNGFVSLGLKAKYRIAVSTMTDNGFQVVEDCSIVKNLDELIDVRNRFVHPNPRFYYRLSKHKTKPKKQRFEDHPFSKMKIKNCKRYYAAVRNFDRLFFMQYDRGRIEENRLIKELEKIVDASE